MPHVSSGPPASAGRRPGPGDRLPDGVAAALRVAPGAWRAGRESVVVVLLSSADAAAPGDVRELAAADAAFRAWDGRVFVLVEDGRGDGARLVAEATGAPPPVVLADGGGVRRALGLAAGAAGVVVASLTLLSPYPDAQLRRLLPGTLVIRTSIPAELWRR